MFAEVATPMQAALGKLLGVGRFGTVLDEYSKLVAQEAVDAQGTFDFAEKRTPLQLLGYAERNTQRLSIGRPDRTPKNNKRTRFPEERHHVRAKRPTAPIDRSFGLMLR